MAGLQRRTPLQNRAPMKAARQRKCRECREWYRPAATTQKACSIRCAQAIGRREVEKKQAREQAEAVRQAKAERKEKRAWIRKKKQELKTAKQLTQDLQPVFNKWVRVRDADKPCISCGRYDHEIPDHFTGGKVDCGHYRTVGGNPELRFEPLNAHKQCKHCNKDLAGNVVEYRKGLVVRIGPGKLDWLEGPHKAKKYTRDQLLELIDWYRKDTRRMEKERQ